MESNLTQRILTAIVMVPTMLALVIFAPAWPFAAAVAVLAVLTIREYFDLAAKQSLEPQRYIGYALAALCVALPMIPNPVPIEAAMVVLTLTIAMYSRSLVAVGPSAASTVFGVLYVALPFSLWVRLRMMPGGVALALYAMVIIWISDTAAYFGGRALGRHKLAPRISPGKTWEGAIASVGAAMLFGYFYLHYALPDIPLAFSLIMAVTVNIAGQLGDLAESAMKRGAGVKDSGTLLPGHGGALDRVDALLFAIPVLWYDVILLLPSMTTRH
jgi:phosphatidate cytidylyltransferase